MNIYDSRKFLPRGLLPSLNDHEPNSRAGVTDAMFNDRRPLLGNRSSHSAGMEATTDAPIKLSVDPVLDHVLN
jgi:hypothetical protein